VKLADVQHYLDNTTTAPAGISVERDSRGDGTRHTRWRVLANDVASGDWMRTFGTQVDSTGNKMEWAAGWTRYRAEVKAARADQARWQHGSVHDMTRALIRAGKTAVGMMGGGEPHRTAPRDRILSVDLLAVRTALAAVTDPLTPRPVTRARIEKLTGQTKLLLQGIHDGGALPGDAQHKTAKKWDKKVRKKLGYATRQARKYKSLSTTAVRKPTLTTTSAFG